MKPWLISLPAKFKLREPATRRGDPQRPFGVGNEGAALHEILRLLLGNVDVEDVRKGRIIKLRRNELRISSRRLFKPSRVVRLLFDGDVTVSEYTNLVDGVGARNRRFFEHVRDELILCLLARRSSRFTESFLYLYRLLEYTSLAFPMLYALSHREFLGSQKFLKSLVQDEKSGDLKVLQHAVPALSAAGNLNAVTFDFRVSGYELGDVKTLKAELSRSVCPLVQGMEFDDEGEVLFRIPFDSMSVFFAAVRNRCFHFKINESNIDLTRIGGSEEICRLCIDELIYWFALLYTEIIRTIGKQYA